MKDHRHGCARAACRLEAPFEATFGSGKDDCWHGCGYLLLG